MSIYTLERKQLLKAPIEKIWDFFSSPKNLKTLTPPEMNFHIVKMSRDVPAYAGQMIEYRVSPVKGVRVKWLTEITHVEEGKFFVDEQRVGPYAIWHHEHHFEPKDDGVYMTDIITYKIPFGWFGTLLHPFIKGRLKTIFDFRTEQTNKLFS